MARGKSFDDKRARIRELVDQAAPEAAAELRALLGDKNNFIVADAAEAAATLTLSALVPDLVAAFERLLVAPVERDKTCAGKNRIVEALLALDAREPAVLLAGVRHVQIEPAMPPFDAAAALRGLCARGLFAIGHRDALLEVAPLLADPEVVPRLDAAAALGDSGIDEAAALLHLKTLVGDVRPEVIGACYRGLLRLAPRRYVDLVASVVRGGDDEHAELAALALGEERVAGAVAILARAAETRSGQTRRALLLAIALTRDDAGIEHLLGLLRDGPTSTAEAALTALAVLRHDPRLAARVREAAKGRRSKAIDAAMARHFGE